ncbi:hypothetical protein KW797_02490 [Candidatus Parcubacteria bacterium]|nr:hypothetical protein [Candidatus Parcubacteria bacterium]
MYFSPSSIPPNSFLLRATIGVPVLVDLEDRWLETHSIYVSYLESESVRVYVATREDDANVQTYLGKFIALHHKWSIPDSSVVARKDDSALDFRKENLEVLPLRVLLLKKLRPRPGHVFIGVSKVAKRDRWRARLQHKGRCFESTGFTSALDAAVAYDILALKHHGAQAILNFPDRRREFILHLGPEAVGKGHINVRRARIRRSS